MPNDVLGNPYADQALSMRFARHILGGLYQVLPRGVYEAIYDPAFRIYHVLQRRSYAKSIERRGNQRDESSVTRWKRVYEVMPYSLVGASGLEHTDERACDLIKSGVPGAFVECGVARGGSAALLAQIAQLDNPQRRCWFFDSYEGLPDPTEKDLEAGATGKHIRPLPKGSCLGTFEQVSWLLFERFRLSSERITLIKGWFENTLPQQRTAVGPIALLRIDGDWYESTRCCLDQLFDQVSPGGLVIIDDYWSCNGARKATNDFLSERRLDVDLTPDGRGGISFSKPVAQETALELV